MNKIRNLEEAIFHKIIDGRNVIDSETEDRKRNAFMPVCFFADNGYLPFSEIECMDVHRSEKCPNFHACTLVIIMPVTSA